MTHDTSTGALEAITDELRELDFGAVEDYYPEDEAGWRADLWRRSAARWEAAQLDDLLPAVRAGDRAAAARALDRMSEIEREWGDDPTTQAARDILSGWLDYDGRADIYTHGDCVIAVRVTQPDQSVLVGYGDTESEAIDALEPTPIQGEGADPRDRALGWARGAGWLGEVGDDWVEPVCSHEVGD